MALQAMTAEEVTGAGLCRVHLSLVLVNNKQHVGLSSGLMAVAHPTGQNPKVIPFVALLCQYMRFGGTCRVGFYSQKEERGSLR